GMGKPTNFRLGEVAERELDVAKLILVQGVEHIALVLAVIQRTINFVWLAVLTLHNAGVVTGGQAIGTEQPGSLHQVLKLHMAIAFKAWIWSATGGVFIDELLDHIRAKLHLHINGVKRHT